MRQLTNFTSRVFFLVAVVSAGFAVWERLANLFGYTVLRGAYTPWRLIEFAAVALLFVIPLQLWEIQYELTSYWTAFWSSKTPATPVSESRPPRVVK